MQIGWHLGRKENIRSSGLGAGKPFKDPKGYR